MTPIDDLRLRMMRALRVDEPTLRQLARDWADSWAQLPPEQRFFAALTRVSVGQDAVAEVLHHLSLTPKPARFGAYALRDLVDWPEGLDPIAEPTRALAWLEQVELRFTGERFVVETAC